MNSLDLHNHRVLTLFEPSAYTAWNALFPCALPHRIPCFKDPSKGLSNPLSKLIWAKTCFTQLPAKAEQIGSSSECYEYKLTSCQLLLLWWFCHFRSVCPQRLVAAHMRGSIQEQVSSSAALLPGWRPSANITVQDHLDVGQTITWVLFQMN